MRYSINGEFHRVMRITGPSAHLLGLAFSGTQVNPPLVERLGPGEPRLDEMQLRAAVMAEVDLANASLGTNHRVTRIQYVPSDRPDLATYSLLARNIIRRLATEEIYEGSDNTDARAMQR